jgi:signal transduction histidine kinase/CheY-like chemotaxis protein
VFESGKREYSEARYELPVGELWLESWLVPMFDDNGQPEAVIGVARDITDRKRLERQFFQAQKMEAVGQLAGGIAHDFNNLLTAIIGYSEFLSERLHDNPELAADIEEVKKAGERASRLTRQLLAFSRKQVLAPKVLDLNDVITDLYKMLSRVIGEDVRLEVAAAPRLARVHADPGQIEQIILNLAVNARDAMPKGGTLRISTDNAELNTDFIRRHEGVVEGRYVAVSVTDSGCGMTAEVLEHVFEPFFTTKPVGKGTGLGLATVYGIVKQSSGCVSIDSTVGVGTTVTIYLPVAEGAAQTSVEPTRQPVRGGDETILLVEDEAGLRHLMQRTLQRYGYTVLNTDSVDEALALAKDYSGSVDLLVSDVIMPGMNGPDLAQRIVRLRPSISVLYVSGFSNLADSGVGSLSAKASLLAKPFTPQALAVRVRECLDRVARPLGVGQYA